jgi:hypothetical protein
VVKRKIPSPHQAGAVETRVKNFENIEELCMAWTIQGIWQGKGTSP